MAFTISMYFICFVFGDVPTPSIWIKRRKQEKRPVSNESPRTTIATTINRGFTEEATRKLDTEIFRLKPQYALTVTAILPKKDTIREEVDRDRERAREEEIRKKALFKKEKLFNPIAQTNWSPKKTFKRPLKQWHHTTHDIVANPERVHDRERQQVIPLSVPPAPPRRPPIKVPESRMIEVYRPTIREEITEVTETEPLFRQRWKQTRNRPQRPGANALLFTTTQGLSKKGAVASINLDKEDIDQLFRDTGFKLPWRKPLL